jgi:hypothetical protein
MMWSIIWFGKKHYGKSLPLVLLSDPDWFFWAMANDVFTGKNAYLAEEAGDLHYKACNIKIPKSDPENWSVRYVFANNDRLLDVLIVERNEVDYDGFSDLTLDRLSFAVVRKFRNYDKAGGKILVKRFKEYCFGNRKARITKERAEQFFSDPNNFVLPAKSPARVEATRPKGTGTLLDFFTPLNANTSSVTPVPVESVLP